MTIPRIRELQEILGWSDAQLARRLHMTPNSAIVREWCNGRRMPPPVVLEWMARCAAPLLAEPLPPGWDPGAGRLLP